MRLLKVYREQMKAGGMLDWDVMVPLFPGRTQSAIRGQLPVIRAMLEVQGRD